jgi:hypothetical protein
MDHWVPSADTVSRFWKTPFETVEPLMTRLCDEIAINHFTFYTKWYTNGFRSALPFLPNHPESQNVRSDNEWGRRWIEFFHRRGMTVGAMVQSYAYLPGCFPAERTLGTWKDTHRCTGLTPDQDNVIIDPTWQGFTAHFEAMLEEQIRLFPGLDAVFLEFEGLTAAEPIDGMKCRRHNKGDVATGLHPVVCDSISPAIRAQWADSAWDVPERDQWIWTEPVQAILADRLRIHLAVSRPGRNYVFFAGLNMYHLLPSSSSQPARPRAAPNGPRGINRRRGSGLRRPAGGVPVQVPCPTFCHNCKPAGRVRFHAAADMPRRSGSLTASATGESGVRCTMR